MNTVTQPVPELTFALRKNAWMRRVLGVPEVGVLVPLVLLILFFYRLQPALLSSANISSMLGTISFTGVVAVGMTLLMIVGEIDLSVGSVAGLSAFVAAHLMTSSPTADAMSTHPGWSVPAALLAGLGVGAACGLFNGLVSVCLGVPSFITTLGMLYSAKGITDLISKGQPINSNDLPASFNDFGAARFGIVSWSVILFLTLVLAGDFVMRRTVFGRKIQATGGNRQAARLAGINTEATKIACFVLTGTLSALAGILLTASFQTADPTTGTQWELTVIAAVVIGGVSLFGGVGTVLGTLLGLALMQVVKSGLVLRSVDPSWQTVAVGAIMIAAVSVDLLRRRVRR